MSTYALPMVSSLEDSFSYDTQKPTYFTEKLSYHLLTVLNEFGARGVKVYIEDSTPEQQSAAVDSWLDSFRAWLNETEQAVSGWLTESEESRLLPALAFPPAWPAIIGGSAILLYRGAIVRAAVDGFGALAKVSQQAITNRRQAELVRVLDKALLRGSWFSLSRQSNFDEIEDILRTLVEGIGRISTYMVVDGKDGQYKSSAQALYDVFSGWVTDETTGETIGYETITDVIKNAIKDRGILKLLSHIVLTHGGDIEEHEFVLAGETD